MSDSDGALSDALLELAGVGSTPDKKRKKRQSSKISKRRKAELSESEEEREEPESEEGGGGDAVPSSANPYPLEGKYVDEDDRLKLIQMSEIEREDILAERLEEMQRIQDKRNLDQMLKAQSNGGGVDADSVSKAAKRQHAVRGATKEKSRKLDELKARRKAKVEKKRRKTSPKLHRDRSSSPMDMEMSTESESEDGQITKHDLEEEKYGSSKTTKTVPDEDEGPTTMEDLDKCRLSRDMLAKWCMCPWFEDYVKGGWVRYLIGSEGAQPVYRICEITNLGAEPVKPYKVNDKMMNQSFELKHGKSARSFLMDKVSNAPFLPKEFERLCNTCKAEDVKMPSKRELERKKGQLVKLVATPMTESDVTAMLARKNQLQENAQSSAHTKLEKSRLTQARTLAIRRQDHLELTTIDAQLAELASREAAVHVKDEKEETEGDRLAKVNERNRKANLEAVRRAELLEAERKRRERKVARDAERSGTPVLIPSSDPSARLKITPRLFERNSPRPGTSTPNTPLLAPVGVTREVSPLRLVKGKGSLIDSIEVDLVDF